MEGNVPENCAETFKRIKAARQADPLSPRDVALIKLVKILDNVNAPHGVVITVSNR